MVYAPNEVSFIHSLLNNPAWSPILIGLMLISTYLVFNFGLVFKHRKKSNIQIEGKEHMSWYFIRSFLNIGLSPTIHATSIIFLSGATFENIGSVTLAPDFIIFQIGITAYLFIVLLIGYNFPALAIKKISFSASTFFTLSLHKGKREGWQFFRNFLKLLNWIAIISIVLMPLLLLF
jgi:hypothetical protein